MSLNNGHQPRDIRRGIQTLVHQYCKFVAYALPNWKPVKRLQDRSDVVRPLSSSYQMSGGILNRLEMLELLVSNSKQQCVTVVKSAGNKCMNQRFDCIRC